MECADDTIVLKEVDGREMDRLFPAEATTKNNQQEEAAENVTAEESDFEEPVAECKKKVSYGNYLTIPIKFRKLKEGVKIPYRAHPDSIGYDLFYPHRGRCWIEPNGGIVKIPMGFSMKMPSGFYAQIVSRSGTAVYCGVEVIGAPTVIDPDYTGEVFVCVRNTTSRAKAISKNERFAQMLIQKRYDANFIEVEEAHEKTTRGEKGFGSTGAGKQSYFYTVYIYII